MKQCGNKDCNTDVIHICIRTA